jgi:excisionase family DNA binding protein
VASSTVQLTVTQAAHVLTLSPARVRQLIAEGKLVAERTPLGNLIDPDSLEALRRERASAGRG